jgi:putative oxidoreductase
MTFLSNRTPVGIAARILRVILGVIFVYAAWIKLREPWAMFAISIDSYQILPMWAVEIVARALPWFELLLGVLLIAGLWRGVSAAAASLLLAVFFSLMVRALAKGMQIDCGCFGPGERLSWVTLLRDGALLASSLFVVGQASWPVLRHRFTGQRAAPPNPAEYCAPFAGSGHKE